MPKAKNTWNFKALLGDQGEKNLPALRQKAEAESYRFINKWRDRTDYLEKADVLKEALDDFEHWAHWFGPNATEEYYWDLKLAQNQNDPKTKAAAKLANDLAKKISNDIRFFTLKLGKINASKQQEFVSDPRLAPYRHFLEHLFAEAKHDLSEAEEKIQNLYSGVAYHDWVRLTSGFLAKEEREIKIKGKNQTVGYEQLLTLAANENKKLRDEAARLFNDILAAHSDTAEAELNAVLTTKKIDDDLRAYDRPDASRLLSDDIEPATVDALLSSVSKRFDLSARLYKLKAKLLDQKNLEFHERTVPVGKIDREVSYEAATNEIRAVFASIDPEFAAIFDRFQTDGQFDVYPASGKGGGAFCASGLLSHPTYILLNYTGRLRDVMTIAHEMGHGINNELQRNAQNALTFGVPKATAEVASNFIEGFILDRIAASLDRDEDRLAFLIRKLDDDTASIFRQTAAHQFEQELHTVFRTQGYLSKQEIGKLFLKHMKSYMGPAVRQSPGAENWWIYWSHFRDFFYVYSYASGQLIAKAMAAKLKEDPAFIGKVKDFLAAGSSASPREIFGALGIDISDPGFWEQGLAEFEADLREAEKLAKKLNYQI